jgi:hypothetical protein
MNCSAAPLATPIKCSKQRTWRLNYKHRRAGMEPWMKTRRNKTEVRKCADLVLDVKRENVWTLQEVKTAPVFLPASGLASKHQVESS